MKDGLGENAGRQKPEFRSQKPVEKAHTKNSTDYYCIKEAKKLLEAFVFFILNSDY